MVVGRWRRRTGKKNTKYKLLDTPASKVVRGHIQRYTGLDILGQLAGGALKVEDVATLADTKAFIAEQKEILEWAATHLETIFQDVVEIEFHLKEIITKGLKSKEQISKYLKDVLVAGKKHDNSVQLLNAQYTNELGLMEAQQQGELSLEARKARNKLYLLQADLAAREGEIDTGHDVAMTDRDVRKAEAEAKATRRLLLSKGFGAFAGATSKRGSGQSGAGGFGRAVASIFGFGRR